MTNNEAPKAKKKPAAPKEAVKKSVKVSDDAGVTSEKTSAVNKEDVVHTMSQDVQKKTVKKASVVQNAKKVASESAHGKFVVGKVLSNKMQKTIVVVVERTITHPKYGKIMRRRSKLYAHDENEICQVGNVVRIRETRPWSKLKTWVLVEVVS